MRRFILSALALLTWTAAVTAPAHATAATWPARIELPRGFQPEGIEIGRGTTFYVGSIPTGALYKGDLRTGDGGVLYPGGDGTSSIGLAVDNAERVFVAGGNTGRGRVIDGITGDLLATFQFTAAQAFVNDVVIAGDSAWFTDSINPVLYRVRLDLSGFETVPLTGDLVYTTGFNVNGIEATPDGQTLILVQSNTGRLFTAEHSGTTEEIDLGGATVPQGDGILLEGQTLYVLQNRLNRLAVVDLNAGQVVERRLIEGADVPTTLSRFGRTLYAVNARFGTAPSPEPAYWITAIEI